ncbi:hypothetical protein COX69_03695 [Candidatus Falkowbacteria bacterium CG_4_10_14_0_2_um_filter_48_10]|uniref:CBS domain-containing protein n=1 Tax=Candidatus Falkowbacteria bacterium CG23_combo_of_CG06-09_8_20_14_all_49_15 TaxID=1974572 RepID=A0A2G9ZNB8_9BACT|nr:MAG: hypothetical protein COX22_01070 [Candidatus Falkowbacteria bacterium CG23_combo_of_CG06-09_8_20_14_all_49_15]PJA07838.1 MAG: hypothetical protein COX69_03695 [Candidatus Falkowbacteria bacterium CG_4_10_14_0_2_um_filter_48_10]
MWVKDYMFKNVCTIFPETTIAEALRVMVEKKTNSLIVVDKNQKPIGTLSSYTLVREVVPPYLKDDPVFSQFGAEGTLDHYAQQFKDRKVSELMHKDFHVLSDKDAMIEAASYAIKASRRILPVADEHGRLIGAITRTCIKNALYNAVFKEQPINPEPCCCKGEHS